MINSFIESFKLQNTYRVNSLIYALKHLKLIGKLLPYSLYKSKGLKLFANIIIGIWNFISIFLGKLIYLLICFAVMVPIYSNQELAFVNIFFFATIIGGIMNTNLFCPSVDKYYAIFLMRFDAKNYTLSNYLYFLITNIIGLYPFVIYFGVSFNIPLLVLFLIPLYVVSVKNIFNAYSIYDYAKKGKLRNENKMQTLPVMMVIILLILAYGLPYLNIGINSLMFIIISIIVIIIGLLSLRYIVNYNHYNLICKDLIKLDEVISTDHTNINEKAYTNKISNVEIKESNKKGYAFFNEVFVSRHRKMLTNATKNISISLVVIFAILIIVLNIFTSKDKEVNDILKNYLPYYLFIIYFLNRGQAICQTMFMNCDHSMLTYRFYRQPFAILSLFKERLKTLIKLNIIPGFIIAIGTDILLYITGGASLFIYVITFLSIISMSIFFSIHYLVLYYLLQPYNVNLEVKDPAFMTICGFTYFLCYLASQVHIPTMIFGICMCIFTIVYCFLSLYLVYKYAPKTFKLRI